MSDSNIVRIFISSTFSDFEDERNALQEKVFPKIQELCNQYGMQFQAVDLRWGISAQDAQSQETMNICMEELKQCKKLSPRPNFLFLLGNRFGWQPIPSRIPQDEFREITADLSREELELFKNWYLEDHNAIPVAYVLRKRDDSWNGTEQQIRTILRNKMNRIGWLEDDPRRVKYEASATEQEFIKGVMEDPQASNHTLCVLRHIERFPEELSPEIFQRYVDVDMETGVIDDYAQSRLVRLKDQIYRRLPVNNILSYETTMMQTGPVLNYIDNMCQETIERLTEFILARIEARKTEPQKRAEEIEAEQHIKFAEKQILHFIGRKKEHQVIQHYLKDKGKNPLILLGSDGSGKTAFMAKASHELKHHSKVQKVVRFIGRTPLSCDLTNLAKNIIYEINHDNDYSQSALLEEDKTKDWLQWLSLLHQTIVYVSQKRPIILFLDAINQLSDKKQTIEMVRMFTYLPSQVHIILSCTPEYSKELYEILPTSAFYQLGDMSVQEGELLLDTWLQQESRTLQPEQREYVLQQYEKCLSPLFLKLMFEQLKIQRSWEHITEIKDSFVNSSTISDSIHSYLDKIEKKHGIIMTSKALSYLVLSDFGLLEQEWISIISKDYQVIKEFTDRHPQSPKVEILPMNIYSAFYLDVLPFLAKHQDREGHLFLISHTQFLMTIQERYLAEEEKQQNIRGDLISYFEKLSLTERGLRKLAWLFIHNKLWEKLLELLVNEIFLQNTLLVELLMYWTNMENNSTYNKKQIYELIIKAPHLYSTSMLGTYARIFSETGCYNEALEFYEILTQRLTENDDLAIQCSYLNSQAMLYWRLGKKDQSLRLFQELLKQARQLNDKIRLARYLNNFSTIYWEMADIKQVKKLSQEAEEIVRKLENRSELAVCLNIKASITEDPFQALQILKEAEDIAWVNGEFWIISSIKSNKAYRYEKIGNLSKALEMLQKAADSARELGDKLGEASQLFHQMRIYDKERKYDKVILLAETALKINLDLLDQKGLQKCFDLYQAAIITRQLRGQGLLLFGEWKELYREQKNMEAVQLCEKYQHKILNQLICGISPKLDKKVDIGRNNPCHCGSEKKYKKCCAPN